MGAREEWGIAERARKRAVMGSTEKREAITTYLGLLSKATRSTPAEGARMLVEVWSAHRRLDWGCTPQVVRT